MNPTSSCTRRKRNAPDEGCKALVLDKTSRLAPVQSTKEFTPCISLSSKLQWKHWLVSGWQPSTSQDFRKEFISWFHQNSSTSSSQAPVPEPRSSACSLWPFLWRRGRLVLPSAPWIAGPLPGRPFAPLIEC